MNAQQYAENLIKTVCTPDGITFHWFKDGTMWITDYIDGGINQKFNLNGNEPHQAVYNFCELNGWDFPQSILDYMHDQWQCICPISRRTALLLHDTRPSNGSHL
jgi:hypothetical protein